MIAALSALLWKHSANDFPREHNQHISPDPAWTFSKHPQPHILSIYDPPSSISLQGDPSLHGVCFLKSLHASTPLSSRQCAALTHSPGCHRSLTVCSQRLRRFSWKLVLTGHLLPFKRRFDHRPQLLLTSTARRVGEWRDVPHPQLLRRGCSLVDFQGRCVVNGFSFSSQIRLLFSEHLAWQCGEFVAARAFEYG